MTIILKKGVAIAEIKQKLELAPPRKKINAQKYLGVIKLEKDALEIQRELRDEWK